jgi:nicotinate phosphoribosyltransferase
MLQGYFDEGMQDIAVFEFFVRRLPANRNFMLLAGLETALGYLETLRFSDEELEWLRQSGNLAPGFVDGYLADFRFTGDVSAMAEGSIFFPEEPVLRVTAPLPEAQLVESRLINILHYQTLIATKAARCVGAAPGKTLVEFGMRRAHGSEAALTAARASYIAGFAGTATVEAGRQFGIPIFGTMAHSYIQTHDTEVEAFERFARSHPNNIVLLIDTYDTSVAARNVVDLAKLLRADGIEVSAVRIDSGNLLEESEKVRRILDDGGENNIRIFASGDLDEFRLSDLIGANCPIDAFGVGTRLNTSADAPSLDCVYKLQEYAGLARRKRSSGKTTWPGAKQVYRFRNENGQFKGDLVTLDSDSVEAGEALLAPVMKDGKRINSPETLGQIRERAARHMAGIPRSLTSLEAASHPYGVEISESVRALADEVDAQQGKS